MSPVMVWLPAFKRGDETFYTPSSTQAEDWGFGFRRCTIESGVCTNRQSRGRGRCYMETGEFSESFILNKEVPMPLFHFYPPEHRKSLFAH